MSADGIPDEVTTGSRTWQDPLWRDAALSWATDRLAEHGAELTGPPGQPHVRPWSTVFRLPTATGPVWLKAVGSGSAHEPALAGALARWVPGAVLTPLAVDPARRLLLLPDGVRTLRKTGGAGLAEAWEALLAGYAQLQVDTAVRTGELLDLGVPDARPERLPAQVAELLADREALLLGRPDGLTPAVRDRLAAGLDGYAEACRALAAGGVPVTVQHDDLHDANVFVAANRYRYFDWGDATVSHPFLSLLVALRMAARSLGVPHGHPVLLRLRAAYLRPWRDFGSPGELADLADLALRVAPMARALSWRRVLSGVHADERAEHADAVPGWAEQHLVPGPLSTPAG